MKSEIAKKWVAALRSGNYRQGKGALRNARNEFCCLGVLCNLHAQANPEFAKAQTVQVRQGYAYGFVAGFVDSWGALPIEVVDWAGMHSAHGELPSLCLSRLNDSGSNFEYIAAVIEENVERL